jgi:hypothetical protein
MLYFLFQSQFFALVSVLNDLIKQLGQGCFERVNLPLLQVAFHPHADLLGKVQWLCFLPGNVYSGESNTEQQGTFEVSWSEDAPG